MSIRIVNKILYLTLKKHAYNELIPQLLSLIDSKIDITFIHIKVHNGFICSIAKTIADWICDNLKVTGMELRILNGLSNNVIDGVDVLFYTLNSRGCSIDTLNITTGAFPNAPCQAMKEFCRKSIRHIKIYESRTEYSETYFHYVEEFLNGLERLITIRIKLHTEQIEGLMAILNSTQTLETYKTHIILTQEISHALLQCTQLKILRIFCRGDVFFSAEEITKLNSLESLLILFSIKTKGKYVHNVINTCHVLVDQRNNLKRFGIIGSSEHKSRISYDATALIKSLTCNTSIEIFDLITYFTVSLSALCELLHKNNILRKLRLSLNQQPCSITKSGMIIKSLAYNHNLKRCDIGDLNLRKDDENLKHMWINTTLQKTRWFHTGLFEDVMDRNIALNISYFNQLSKHISEKNFWEYNTSKRLR